MNAALTEAHSIVHAMRHGVDMHDVLHIAPETAEELLAFCKYSPDDAPFILRTLKFRHQVRDYIDKILAGEVEELASNAEENEEGPIEAAESASVPEIEWPVQGEEESPTPQEEA